MDECFSIQRMEAVVCIGNVVEVVMADTRNV